jgi:four helix bundle protein
MEGIYKMKNSERQVDFNIKDFRSLKVYQKSIELADIIYKLTKRFPSEEKYRLTDQMVRAATSIGANIAKGVGQGYKSKTINFCNIAMGSTNEMRHWITVARMQTYISDDEFKDLDGRLDEILRMLIGYMRMVSRKIDEE